MCELKYWIALSCAPGVGSGYFFRLVNAFGSPREAWRAHGKHLQDVFSGNQCLLTRFTRWRACTDPDRLLDELRSSGVEAVTFEDSRYPSLSQGHCFTSACPVLHRHSARTDRRLRQCCWHPQAYSVWVEVRCRDSFQTCQGGLLRSQRHGSRHR